MAICIDRGARGLNSIRGKLRGGSALAGALVLLVTPGAAWANCTGTTNVICTVAAPNPYTQRIGSGPNTASGATVSLDPGAQVVVGNLNAISLGNNATITLGANSVVSNNATSSTAQNGLWGGGPNTIEFGSNGTLTINLGATVAATGTQNNGEPINVFGANNTIVNYGTITSRSGAAIWFEDKTITPGTTNTVDNHGTIITQLGSSANVIGNSGNGPVTFINRTSAVVQGSLSFAGGDDNLTLEAGSVITGGFNGGGGTNTLTLSGVAGSSDSLSGDIRNFQTLTKIGDGTWTLTGAVGANGGNAALGVFVNQGTLALTGNNANFNGGITVNTAGTLEARAQSLPPSITDNGLVRFVQDTSGHYNGVISGGGNVEKTLGGTLTLNGSNTYTGITTVNAGIVSIARDNNLGAGALILNGGTLETTASFASSRPVVLQSLGGGGTIQTDAGTTLTYNGAISGGFLGDGSLYKTGTGTLVLTNTGNSFGAIYLNEGVLQVDQDAELGPSGILSNATTLRFNGGTLNTTASFADLHATYVDTNGGTIQTDAGTTLTYMGSISGSGVLTKIGAGTLDLSNTPDLSLLPGVTQFTGGYAIDAGTVRIASDANLGAAGAPLSFDTGTLAIAGGASIARTTTLNAGGGTIDIGGDPYDPAAYVTMSGLISGAGGLSKTGSGSLFLTGNNSYAGPTNVTGGFLMINGDQSAATGAVNVSGPGTRLSGDGIIGGDVNLSAGAVFGPAAAPNTPAKLTVNGDMTISSDSVLLYNIIDTTVGGALNDLTNVAGNLVLDGRIDVVDQGQTLGPGVYRIFNYGGTLTDNGLEVGSYATVGDAATRALDGFTVQTAIPGQVNLINTQGLALTYWDGDTNANWNNNAIEGGGGIWSLNNPPINWTNADGSVNAAWSNGGFAIFIGASGVVTVSNNAGQVQASGMQFGVGGYLLDGAQPLMLVDDGSSPGSPTSTIRVGDGTGAGASMTAAIGVPLSGDVRLRKTDAGVLTLISANLYTGGTAIDGGTVRIAADSNLGAAAGGLSFDGGTLNTTGPITSARVVTLDAGGGTIDTNGGTTLTLTSAMTGVGDLTKAGGGTLLLTADGDYTGGTIISAGTLRLGNGGTGGAILGDVEDNAALVVNRSDSLTLAGTISGTGTLTQAGTGRTILTADNSYAGLTTISAGTLQLGDGGTTGSVAGAIVDGATLDLRHGGAWTLASAISGTGALVHDGNGITTLTADNSYKGATDIQSGWLYINGDQSAATGAVSVASGARLGGGGIVGGDVTLADGASLAPGAVPNTPATITINGNLTLSGGSQLIYNMVQANVAGGALNDLAVVNGDLTLDGRIDIIDQGQTMGPGVYRIINYTGNLIDNGLDIGNYEIPPATPQDGAVITGPITGFTVQTSVAHQVNLVNTQGLSLNYWDATAPHNNNLIDGGTGTWQAKTGGNDNWTGVDGALNAQWNDGDYAIFMGVGGTVTVDNSLGQVTSQGMQFASDGYHLVGGELYLQDPANASSVGVPAFVRVGDGTPAGAAITATIDNNIAGGAVLIVSDLGTLVLNGTNDLSGVGIDAATLQVSSSANLGSEAGLILISNSGTMRATGDFTNGRMTVISGSDASSLVPAGTIDTAGASVLTQTGYLGDAVNLGNSAAVPASFTKAGTGTLILANDLDSFQGATTVAAGTLQIGDGATSGWLESVGGIVIDSGARLVFDRADNGLGAFASALSGDGGLTKNGAGTITLSGENSYAGGTTITAGTLQIGDGGASGSIIGDTSVAAGATLAFNRANSVAYAGNVSGGGALLQQGSGTLVYTGAATQTGGTTVAASSTLQLGDGGTTGSILGDIANGGVLVFDRSDTITFAGAINNGATSLGSVRQAGSGTTILTGLNTYSGGTTISAGALQIGDGVTNGQIFNDILNNGTFIVYESAPVVIYQGAVTGTGNVIKKGADTVIMTGTATYTGGTIIEAGTLQLGNEGGDDGTGVGYPGAFDTTGATGAIVGDVTVAGGATLAVNRSNSLLLTGAVSGGGAFDQMGSGTTILEADQSYTGGTTITAGTLQIGNGGTTGSVIGDITDNGTLAFNRADTYTPGGVISGTGEVMQIGLGTLIIDKTNSYSGGTAIESGTIQIARDDNLGDIAGPIRIANAAVLHTTADITTARETVLAQGGGGTFDTDTGTTLTHDGVLDGAGGLAKAGAGMMILTAANSYAGPTNVLAGTLRVNGDQTAATGATSVAAGATLGGGGIIGGDVTIANGGILSPGNSPGTLTINGTLTLNAGSVLNYEFGQANVVGGTLNDLTEVKGDLVLDGTLNVSVPAGGTFDTGVYRVFDYAGALTDNGLVVGMIPATGYYVQTSIAGQVNLINTSGLVLNYWDGQAGPKSDGVINGGDGVWQAMPGNDNWTTSDGALNAAFSDGAYAFFGGLAGTVTVDASLGPIDVGGMQFMTDGYVVTGDTINLTGLPGTQIRVGDGTPAGAGMTATIGSVLAGDATLTKVDAGTLVLTGVNLYTGGTAIDGGVVRVSQDANLGAASGGLALDGGTLNVTASFASTRAVTLGTGGGTFATDAMATLTLTGAMAGEGALTKTGAGTLILNGANGYAGGTVVIGGVLQIARDANLGAATGAVMIDGATLATTGDVSTARAVTLGASGGTFDTAANTSLTLVTGVAGTGGLTKTGAGTLILTAANIYAGPTSVSQGTLALDTQASIAGPVQIASGATLGGQGTIAGDVINAGTVAVADATPVFTGRGTGALTIGGVLTNSGTVQLGGAGVGNRLIVASYVGQGGAIALNTALGGDSSPTDQLVINGGTASGATTLRITNVGGGGALTSGNGIPVVLATAGATTAADAFALSGYLAAGPYRYSLYQGGVGGSDPNSWFLRSVRDGGDNGGGGGGGGDNPPPPPATPDYRPEVPTYTATPAMTLMFGRDLIGTLQERVGDQARQGAGIWGRILGERTDWNAASGDIYSKGPSFSTSNYAMQIGADALNRGSAGSGLTVAGAYGSIGWSQGTVRDHDMTRAGRVRFDAYTGGLYATHYGKGGWYADAVAQATRYVAHAGSGNYSDMTVKGTGLAASLELGAPYRLGGGFSIEPQGQMIWQHIAFADAADPAARVGFGDVRSLTGRLGLRFTLDGARDGARGPRPFTAWVRANLWHEFQANPRTSFSSAEGDVPFREDMRGSWAELGAGASAEMSRSASLFVNGGRQMSLGDGTKAWKFRAGLRFDW